MVQVIAEFCQNHNGDANLLKRMIDEAAEAGATHAKVQNIFAENLAFRPQFEEGLVSGEHVFSIKRPYQSEYDRLKNLELKREQVINFIDDCRKAGLEPMTTCFARCHVDELVEMGFKTIKVASYDCASFQLLRELKGKFERILVSTGATYDDEVQRAAEILDGSDFTFLHCVTMYPTPLVSMHLSRMKWLLNYCNQVGFSDHTLVARDGIVAAKAAIHLGAEVVERHFTVLAADESRDGPVSITPAQLKELVSFSKLSSNDQLSDITNECPDWKKMIGDSSRTLSHEEILNRDYYRGRFASPRHHSKAGRDMVFNWEETRVI